MEFEGQADLLEAITYLIVGITCDGGIECDLEPVDPIEANYGDNVYKDLKMLLKKGLITKEIYDKLYKNQKNFDKTNEKIEALKKKKEIPYFELKQILDELQVEIDNLYTYGRMDFEKHHETSDKINTILVEIAKREKERTN